MIVPCCTFIDYTGDGKGILGDLKNSNSSLKEMFYESTAIKEIRRAHIDNRLERIAPFCIQCDEWRQSGIDKIWTKKMKQELRP